MAEEQKMQRALALQKLKEANRKLQENVANKRTRMIEKFYAEVHTQFSLFEEYHIKYALAAKVNMEAESMVEIFFEASGVVDLADVSVENWKEHQEVAARTAEIKALEEAGKAKAAKDKKLLSTKYKSEMDSIMVGVISFVNKINNDEEIVHGALKKEMICLEKRFLEVTDSLPKILAFCKDDEFSTYIEEHAEKDKEFREHCFTIKGFLEKNDPNSDLTVSRSSSPTGDRGFKTKKLDFPTFSGNMREYATFKRDFTDIVVNPAHYDKTHMSHILRNQCLSGEAKSLVHNILDYDQVWIKLEDKYNDESEVIEMITKQITSLKLLEEGDYSGLVRLVDTLEKANLDLSASGNTAILNNPMTVRLVMSRCPRTIREEIATQLNGKSPTEEFDVMLNFLIPKRKNAMRLSRIQVAEPKPKQPFQGKQKGFANAAGGVAGGQGTKPWATSAKTGWSCIVSGCTYRQKHFLSECRTFKRLDENGKGKIILDKKLCILCFGEHPVANCPKKTSGWKPCDVGGCGKWHSRMLHGASVPGLVLLTRDSSVAGPDQTLLLIQSIPTASGSYSTTFWDNGSTTSLVSFKFADSAGLEGVNCSFELTGVGEKTETYQTKLYTVPLVDRNGVIRTVHAFGIDKITADMKTGNLNAAALLFNLKMEQLQRPEGAVDLLIGMEHIDIMPTRWKLKDKLALHKSIFGTGFVLGGKHKEIYQCGEIDKFAHCVSHVEVRNIKPLDFLSAEAFGVDIPRRCKNCKGCKECGYRASQLTWTEAKELAQIEKGLTLDTVNKVWTAEYPFHTDPALLKNNYNQAYACMASLEKRLIKTGNIEKFNEQFQESIDRKVFVEITKDDIQQYTGPVNYITITEAYKEGENSTTPLRLCMNSSMKFQGLSLNDLLMKGPSALNNIYSVLLNFRKYPAAFVKDLSKFYNSVLASTRDQHLRRVLWRGGEEKTEPKVYITKTVNFGDKPAGCVALTAVRETADLYRNIDPEAASKLKNDNYVDDIASGADTIDTAKIISENMEKIVAQGGFKFKKTVMSGDDVEPMKVLGTGWDPKTDTLFLEVKINVSSKRKGIRIEPDLDLERIGETFPSILTKRIIWRVVLGQFDLLGLASVFFIRLKLLMRDLSDESGRKIGWDESVPEGVRKRFLEVLEQLAEVRSLRFPRCFKPQGVDEEYKPDLVCFGDGSKQAFCSLAYIRWRMKDGRFKSLLASGKTRVAPLRKISIPRIELMGAVASVRLAENIQESTGLEFGRRFFFTDSSAVFGMITGECGAFQEFVGTRTGEIKSKSNPVEEWFWLPTHENLADMGTRDDVTPSLLHPYSVYLNGTLWMGETVDNWPVNQQPGKVPEEELTPAARTVMAGSGELCLIDLSRFSSFNKVKRVLSLVLNFIEKVRSKKDEDILPAKSSGLVYSTEYLTQAENYLIFKAQTNLMKDYRNNKLESLLPKLQSVKVLGTEIEILVTSGRSGGAMLIGYDKEELPIIPYNSPVARLIMKYAHDQEHCGADRTLWRSRNYAWIIRGRRIAKVICRDCFKCRLRNKNLAKQIMGPLPEHRLPPAPVFYTTAVDLFGPIDVRDTVKRRVKRKCWGVIFVCTVTAAIHLEVSEDYSCDSFLLCMRRFTNLRGTPNRIQSDPGSQLMAAAVEIGRWDYSRIHEWAADQQTEWNFVPADSQHFNGCAEALIKVTKKQLNESLKSKLFTKGELDTFMSDVCLIVNSRPLMKRAAEDPLSGGPITPLHLIGGRCTTNVPVVMLDARPSLTKRLKFIEDTTDEFWRKWFTQVFQNLVPTYKWKKEFRDVQVGDVVLLKESNLLKREYKLGRIKEAKPGEDGHVRRVVVEYKNLKPTGQNLKDAVADLRRTEFSQTERSIHNVVVIVPADWSQEDIESVIAQETGLKCAF